MNNVEHRISQVRLFTIFQGYPLPRTSKRSEVWSRCAWSRCEVFAPVTRVLSGPSQDSPPHEPRSCHFLSFVCLLRRFGSRCSSEIRALRIPKLIGPRLQQQQALLRRAGGALL
eukprot:7639505-Prorocentrum_lima.AAC.1